MYRDVKGLSGATILGDGGIALILDIPQLIEIEEIEEQRSFSTDPTAS
jgi:two-component system chemotaxis sensor kinase CheA